MKWGWTSSQAAYKTQGPTDDLFKNCYWQRTKDDSGQFRSIICQRATRKVRAR